MGVYIELLKKQLGINSFKESEGFAYLKNKGRWVAIFESWYHLYNRRYKYLYEFPWLAFYDKKNDMFHFFDLGSEAEKWGIYPYGYGNIYFTSDLVFYSNMALTEHIGVASEGVDLFHRDLCELKARGHKIAFIVNYIREDGRLGVRRLTPFTFELKNGVMIEDYSDEAISVDFLYDNWELFKLLMERFEVNIFFSRDFSGDIWHLFLWIEMDSLEKIFMERKLKYKRIFTEEGYKRWNKLKSIEKEKFLKERLKEFEEQLKYAEFETIYVSGS